MKLNIISQIIRHYHEYVNNNSEDPRNDFPIDHNSSQIEDPLGGQEGITKYDRFNLDQDWEK